MMGPGIDKEMGWFSSYVCMQFACVCQFPTVLGTDGGSSFYVMPSNTIAIEPRIPPPPIAINSQLPRETDGEE